ncbi:MAG: photosynthetic complex assembly protein PuhC [Pseudomonadota bacterium]
MSDHHGDHQHDAHRGPRLGKGQVDSRHLNPVLLWGPVPLAGFAIVAMTLVFVLMTGDTRSSVAEKAGQQIAARTVAFNVATDGRSVTARDPADGQTLDVFRYGEHGLLATVLESLAFERARKRRPAESPFRLALSDTGRLTFHDPETDSTVLINAYGKKNVALISRLLKPERTGQ